MNTKHRILNDIFITDAHTHIFPDKIAEKASLSISSFYNGAPMFSDARLKSLLASGATIGTDRFLICSSAVVPEQAEGINMFMSYIKEQDEKLYALGSLHPDNESIGEILDNIISLGLHGIKLHPDFQHFNIDSDKAMALYSECADRNLPVLFHMGDDRYDFSSPERLRNVVSTFPRLKVHAAHFGGYTNWDKALELLSPSDNLYFDTSSSLYAIDRRLAYKFFLKFGIEKFMFGTDFPMWEPSAELERFLSLDLSRQDLELVMSGNFDRLYGIV